MKPRFTPQIALAAALAVAGCVEQRESAPVVYRGTVPGQQQGQAFPAAPVATQPLDVAPSAGAAPDGRGVVDYGGYSAVVAQTGDTVESMAARAGVSASALASYNGLPAGYAPRPGDELILPPAPRGSSASVETVPLGASTPAAATQSASAASTSGFDMSQIEASIGGGAPAGQSTTAPQSETPAQTAQAPQAAPVFTPVETPAASSPTARPESQVATAAPATQAAPTQSAPAQQPTQSAPAQSAPAARFSKPVDGPIVRPYSRDAGAARNDGVDFAAPAGAAVRAAADGQVALVSESLGGLGTIVLIRHANDILTVYGRVEGVSVQKGDRVSRGQSIGVVAPASGGADTSMHFEVRRGADSVDPADYL